MVACVNPHAGHGKPVKALNGQIVWNWVCIKMPYTIKAKMAYLILYKSFLIIIPS